MGNDRNTYEQILGSRDTYYEGCQACFAAYLCGGLSSIILCDNFIAEWSGRKFFSHKSNS